MKSLIIKATILVVAAAGLSQYMHFLVTGKNPLDKLKMPSLSLSMPTLPDKPQTVYKWVDEKGVTQYSAEPPPEHANAETLELDPNVNIVQSTEIRDEKEEDSPTSSSTESHIPEGSIYNPETIKQVMDKAKNVQNLLNERTEKHEAALNEL